MTTLVLSLFSIAWALVVLLVVRALLIVAKQDRKLATAAAAAVAGAFVVGALSPFSLWTRNAGQTAATAAAGTAAAPVAAAPAPAAVKAVICPSTAKIAGGSALGHIDAATEGATQLPTSGTLSVTRGGKVALGGWIVAAGNVPASAVCVVVDAHPVVAELQYGIDRPDVATALSKAEDRSVGFGATFVPPPGSHSVSIGVVEADGTTVHLLAPPLRITSQ